MPSLTWPMRGMPKSWMSHTPTCLPPTSLRKVSSSAQLLRSIVRSQVSCRGASGHCDSLYRTQHYCSGQLSCGPRGLRKRIGLVHYVVGFMRSPASAPYIIPCTFQCFWPRRCGQLKTPEMFVTWIHLCIVHSGLHCSLSPAVGRCWCCSGRPHAGAAHPGGAAGLAGPPPLTLS